MVVAETSINTGMYSHAEIRSCILSGTLVQMAWRWERHAYMSAENWGWSIGSILHEFSVVSIMQKKHNVVTSVIKKLIAHYHLIVRMCANHFLSLTRFFSCQWPFSQGSSGLSADDTWPSSTEEENSLCKVSPALFHAGCLCIAILKNICIYKVR